MNYEMTDKQFSTLYTIAESMMESGSSDARLGGKLMLDVLVDVEVEANKNLAQADAYWDKVADQYDRDVALQEIANGIEQGPISIRSVDEMFNKMMGVK